MVKRDAGYLAHALPTERRPPFYTTRTIIALARFMEETCRFCHNCNLYSCNVKNVVPWSLIMIIELYNFTGRLS